jgi:hypothetical protein
MVRKDGQDSVAQRGRRLVAAELAGRGLSLAPGPDRRRSSHMLATDAFGHATPLIVRVVHGGGWQLSAEKFLRIEIDEARGRQRVRGREPLARPDTPVVYVWIGSGEEPHRYFILPEWMVQAVVYRTHRWWMRHWGWTRPRRPKSTHCAIWPADLEAFEGDWDQIFERFEAPASDASPGPASEPMPSHESAMTAAAPARASRRA